MACSPPPPALPDELVEEILLRLPPDEPGYLVHTALVCKPWRHILSEPRFRRRYLDLHRSPPLLGYIHNIYQDSTSSPRFVSTSSTASPFSPPINSRRALDCRHGRVLIETYDKLGLIVWDPVTGDQHHLNMTNYPGSDYGIGAVLCAVDGCNHLDCHGGPFRVVLVGMDIDVGPFSAFYEAWVTMYSSETGEWSSQTIRNIYPYSLEEKQPSLLIGDALYFTLDECFSVLKYDLNTHALSTLDLPCVSGVVVTTAEDGGLGFIALYEEDIYMWSSLIANAEENTEGWDEGLHFVMELGTLLPSDPCGSRIVCSVEGTDIIFITSNVDLFTLNLKSRQVRKVGHGIGPYNIPIFPYRSFYIPDFSKGKLPRT